MSKKSVSLLSLNLDDSTIPCLNSPNNEVTLNIFNSNINSPSIMEHPASTSNIKSNRRRYLTSRKSLAHSIDFENFNRLSPRPGTLDCTYSSNKLNISTIASPMPSPHQSPLPIEPVNEFFRKSTHKQPTEEEKEASWQRFHSLVNKLTDSSLIKNSNNLSNLSTTPFEHAPSTQVHNRGASLSNNHNLFSPNKLMFSPMPSFSENDVATLNKYTLGIPELLEEDSIHTFESVINNHLSDDEFKTLIAKLDTQESTNYLIRLYKSFKHFKLLLEVSQTITSSTFLDKDAIFQRIINCSYALVDCEKVTLFIVDENGDNLVVAISQDVAMSNVIIPFGAGIAGTVAKSGTSLLIYDAYSDNRFLQKYDQLTGFITKSILCVPVFDSSGQVVAVLQALNKRSDDASGFYTEDLTVFEFLALIAGHTLSQVMLYEEALVSRHHTQVLLDIQKQLSLESSTESVIEKIFDAAYSLVQAERILLFLVDSERSEFVCKVSKDSIGLRLPMGQGLIGQVAITCEPLICNNVEEHQTYSKNYASLFGFEQIKSALLIPIRDPNGSCIAIIEAFNKKDGNFDELDQKLLDSMGSAAGLTLRKAQIYESAIAGQRKTQALLRLVKSDLVFSGFENNDSDPNSIKNLEILWDQIIGVAEDLIDAEVFLLYIVDSNKEEIWTLVNKDSNFSEININASNSIRSWSWKFGIAGSVATNGVGANIRDVSSDPRFDPSLYDIPFHFQTQSLLCMPIKDIDGSTIAVLEARNKKTGNFLFNDDDSELLNTFCNEVGNVLRKYITEMTLQKAAHSCDHDVQSMMEFYMSRQSPRSRNNNKLNFSVNTDLSSPTFIQNTPISSSLPAERRGSEIIRTLRSRNFSKSNSASFTSNKSHYFGNVNNSSFYCSVESSFKFSKSIYGNCSPSLSSPALQLAMISANSLDFNVFDFSHIDLIYLAFGIIQNIDFIKPFSLPLTELFNFICTISCRYRDNPFHNWRHGFSVLQFIYWGIHNGGFTSYLTNLDILGMVISSFCHDVDHPGQNNQFEIDTQSQLALLYNDESVLENFHASTTFSILRQESCNIFKCLNDCKSLRKIIIKCILSTDMANHFSMCKKVDQLNSNVSQTMPSSTRNGSVSSYFANDNDETKHPHRYFDVNSSEDRTLLSELLIHAADISGQIYSNACVVQEWERRISSEFLFQASLQRKLGIPVAGFMDNLENAPHRAKLQVSFIDFVLTPLWKAILRVLPNLRTCYDNLLNNRKIYQAAIASLEYEKDCILKSKDYPISSSPSVYGFTPVDSMGILPPITRYSYIQEEVATSASVASSRLGSFVAMEPLQIPINGNDICTVPSPDAMSNTESGNVNIFGFIGDSKKCSPIKSERPLNKTTLLKSPEKFSFVRAPKSPRYSEDFHSDSQLQNLFPVVSLLKNFSVSPMIELPVSPSTPSMVQCSNGLSPLNAFSKSEKRPSVFNLSFPHQLTSRIKKSESLDHSTSNSNNDTK